MLTSPARWAEVDLSAVAHNVRLLRAGIPAHARLIAVVKANGYGHGAREVGRAALQAGADLLGVSTPAEAVALAGVCGMDRVLALGGLAPQTLPEAVAAGCALVCHSAELADALELAVPAGERRDVHLKVDTGMGRLGCRPEEAPALASRIARSPRLRLAGTMTHFASAESDEAMTRAQFARFQEVLSTLQVPPGLRHAANSAAALRHPDLALDGVRCGIALYGCEWPQLRPALRLRALVTQVRRLGAGQTVGYNAIWQAPRDSLIATVGAGYADGVLRARSSRGAVVVRSRRAPLVGRVSMDQLTLDVTDVPGVRPGDEATLIGDGISAEEVAGWSGTSSYEVLCAIGPRVRRLYVGGGTEPPPSG